MRSLRLRLFIVLLATFAVAWGVTLTILGVQFSREHTGVWDRNLDEVAREILVSMPADVSRLDSDANLRLPDDDRARQVALALHEAAGFRVVGTRQRIGRHHGRWRDVVLVERRSPNV